MDDEPERVECPVPAAHHRLQEAHDFWHAAQQHYDEPDRFRTNLNALIQALRNVTFVLQKQKHDISDFDTWYSRWQERFKADPLMKWIVTARNIIVKVGDLQLHSTATMRLVASFLDPETRTVTEEMPPESTPADYAERLGGMQLAPQFLREGNICIERRWVADDLPDHELLEVCAHAYGELSQLLDDLHDRIGVAYATVVEVDDGVYVEVPGTNHSSGRLPCMIAASTDRTTCYRVEDGALTTGGRHFSIVPDPQVARKSAKRYGIAEPMDPPEHLVDLAGAFMSIAKRMMAKDKNHGTFVFFYRGVAQVHAEAVYVRDQADKYLTSRHLADLVRRIEADGVLMVGDMWHAPLVSDGEGGFIRPGQSDKRGEALLVHVENAHGDRRTLVCPYRRRLGRIIFEDVREEPQTDYMFIEPIRRVWQDWQSPPET